MRFLASKKPYILITLLFIGVSFIPIIPFIVAAAEHTTTYEPLDPTFFNNQQQSLNFINYAKIVYQTILLVVIVLSIVMVALGGLEYAASGVAGAKMEGKERIWNAIIGLLIALASYLILYTIDPRLVNFNPDFLGDPIDIGSSQTYNPNPPSNNNGGNNGGGGGGGGLIEDHDLDGPRREGETNAQAILRNAVYAADNGVNTCGRRACAGAANDIIFAATGEYAGGGASTASMYEALQNNPNFQLVQGGISNAQPGDIIISPTAGGVTGHVGFCETAGCGSIISNSSSQVQMARNFTSSSWINNYNSLGIYIFRPVGP